MPLHSEDNPSARFVHAIVVVLVGMIVLLSYQVITLKDQRERLVSDAEAATRAFARGLPVPRLALVSPDGRTATLDQHCTSGKRLVAFFTDVACTECDEITPLVRELSSSTADVTVVAVYSTSFPPEARGGDSSVRNVRSSVTNVVNVARVSGAPSVIASDTACNISAAGAGLTGSRLVLERVLREAKRTR